MSKQTILFLCLIGIMSSGVSAFETPKTYFAYSSGQLEKLQGERSSLQFSKQDLQRWDSYVGQAFSDQPASLVKFRIFTYLYLAQEEAAKLSEAVKGELAGSVDPVSYAVIELFLPNQKKPTEFQEDRYSRSLAEMIGKKIAERVEREDSRQVAFEVPKELQDHYFVGLTIAKWLPWYAIPTTAYMAPPPPPMSDKTFWNDQIAQIRKEQKPLTNKKKEAVRFWAGLEDPEKSDWRVIANDYLFSKPIALPEIIHVRSVLTLALYDAFIVSFNAKYRYAVLRPSFYDPELETVIAVPKHPSYPSNHSVTSAAASTVLSYFFPAQANQWKELESEACQSRIWGAIHYPIDDEEGRKSGRQVAEAVLDAIEPN